MSVILQQLEAETIRKYENNTAAQADIDRWLRDSLVEISGNPDYRDSFPDLEILGPTFALTGGAVGTSVQEYPEGSFLPATTSGTATSGLAVQMQSNVGTTGIPISVAVPSVVDIDVGSFLTINPGGGTQEIVQVIQSNPGVSPTFVATFQNTHLINEFVVPMDYNIKSLDFMIWIDFPNNTQRRRLEPTQFQDTDAYQSYPSLPTQWYRFGNLIGFDPTPNKNYQVQARLQRRNPITDYFNVSGLLNQTIILLPKEWYEVIEWAAAMRGFMEGLNFERANAIKMMLWGDPEHPNDNPGLIASVKTKRRNEAWLVQQSLRPVIKQSCWGM